LLEAVVPGLDVGERRALGVHVVPAPDRGSQGDIRHGELIAAQEVASRELIVDDPPVLTQPCRRRGELLRHLVLFEIAHDGPEYERYVCVRRGLLPVHPLIGARAFADVRRAQTPATVLRGEITYDDVGLPEHEAVVIDGGNPAVGVELGVEIFVDDTVRHAGIDTFVRETELLDTPHHFHDVD
jgi:hypothetical protein